MAERTGRLRAAIGEHRPGIDGLLVTGMSDIRYLTGFTGSSAFVVLGGGRGVFLTDSRYAEQAKEEVRGPFRVSVYRNKSGVEASATAAGRLGLKSLGFDGDNIRYNTYRALRRRLKGLRLINAAGLASGLRRTKDPLEVRSIKKSAALLDSGFEFAASLIGPGVAEREVAASIEARFKALGAEDLAFDTIVASGKRGALPHGKPSAKKIRKGEFVVLDMGVVLGGYNSDETRTFCVGRATRRHREVYGTVLEAQARAIGMVRPGVLAGAVDRAARGHIRRAGYGRFFGHATGHGVGLDIHEPPSVGPGDKTVLEEGMVITVEPGVYLPGWGGVRIEDMVLVTSGGCELLTGSRKELICL
ncbi:MAG: M24 family metallopeptidase [Thermodesulfobacteriota bacterium]